MASALGTLTLVANKGGQSASEPVYYEEVTLVGDAEYATGGTAGLQAAYRLKGNAQAGRTILTVLPVDCKGYVPGWDSTTGKLKFYRIGALDGNAAAAQAMAEVAAAFDLSGVTFKLLIVSQ